MKKAIYNNLPLRLEAVGNGSFLYRWAIEKILIEKETLWQCFEVLIFKTPTRENVTEAVLTALYPTNEEMKLINDYNAAKEGVMDVSFIQIYRDFLTQRAALKLEIKKFFSDVR